MADQNESQESLRIVDTSNVLTKEELQELKHLAALSKTSKIVIGVVFGIIGMVGLPAIFDWLKQHLN
jgi:predicted transcriptional regulator